MTVVKDDAAATAVTSEPEAAAVASVSALGAGHRNVHPDRTSTVITHPILVGWPTFDCRHWPHFDERQQLRVGLRAPVRR